MNQFIARHDASMDAYRVHASRSKEDREQQVSLLEVNSSVAHLVLSGSRVNANMHLAIDPGAQEIETWESWTTYMEVAESVFAVSQAPKGAKVERVINRKLRSLVGTGASHSANAKNWLDAFFLALSCRDERRVLSLGEVPVASMRQAHLAGGAQANEYVYFWISALQDYMLGRPSLPDNLMRSFQLSDPMENPSSSRELLNGIIFPQLNSFYRASEQNAEEFNKAIGQGFQKFRSYYTRTEELSKGISGVIPLGLLGISCLAFDLGENSPAFNPEFNSDYLPENILKRTWERYLLS